MSIEISYMIYSKIFFMSMKISQIAYKILYITYYIPYRGWSGGAMVLGKLQVPGRPTILITVGQGPTALVVGAGGGCLDVFTLIYSFLFSFSHSLGDGPISSEILSQTAVKPKATNQPTNIPYIMY